MKVKVNYVGGSSYTIGNVIEVAYDGDEIIVHTHSKVAGATIDKTIIINKADVMYAVVHDGCDLTIIAGKIKDFNVNPSSESLNQLQAEQKEEKRIFDARAKRAENNRVRLAAKHKKEWLAKNK